MSSRIRSDVEHIFECFCEVIHLKGAKEPNQHIVSIFPEEFSNDFLKCIPEFTFPCQMEFNAVQHFSFALTSIDSTWTYGFCRHEPFTQRALVIVSHFPYHDAFYELLDHVADLMRASPEGSASSANSASSARPAVHSSKAKRQSVPPSVAKYLYGFYTRPVPLPQPFKLPTLPDNINLTEYFCALDFGCMVAVMASLLHERRIMMVSRKLSRLSACVQAANQLIYPLEWQGIYIPVLPNSLKDCLLAPMPYLIGVPYPVYETLVLHDIGDVVTIFLDTRTVTSPFDDVAAMPQEILEDLLAALESCKNLVGDAVARAFLQTLVHLLGGIENAIRSDTGLQPTFDEEAFVTSRGSGVQPFLREMLNFQMFQQFLEGRLALVAAKAGCSDEFARECCAWEENQKLRKRWKRKPAQILKNLKNKTQPAMDSAIKTVRSGNKGMKSAYKGLKNKLVVARRSLGGPSVPIGAAEWWERPGSSQDSSCSSEPTIVKVLPQTLDNETSPQDLISLAPGDDRSSLASHGIICMEDYAQEEEILIRQSEERFYERLPHSDTAFSPAVFASPQKGHNPSQLIVPDIVCYFDSAYEPASRPGPSWQQPEVSYSRRKTGTSLLEELLETTGEVAGVATPTTRNNNCISSPVSTHSSHLLEDNLTRSGISEIPRKLPSNNVSGSTPIRKPYQPHQNTLSSIPASQIPFRNTVSVDLLPDNLFQTRSLPPPRSGQPYFSPASTPTHSPLNRPSAANSFQLPSPISPHPAPLSPQQPTAHGPTVSPLVLAGLADNDGLTPIDRIQEDELLEQYGIDFQKFNISRKNWTKFE